MKKIVFGIIIVGLLGVFSCKERIPYVLAEQVQIEYYDSIQVEDWIEIDGIRFKHVTDYSVLKEDSVRKFEILEKHLLPTTIEGVTVVGAEKEFKQRNIETDMAYALFLNLAQKDQDGAPFYTFRGTTMDMSRGIISFVRTDGEKIKVSTSKGYGAAVRKIK